jgi:hypothetical protein
MGRARRHPLLIAAVMLIISLMATVLYKPAAVSAGVYRGHKNEAEKERMKQCNIQPYTIYGVTWLNGVGINDTTDARWNETKTVAYDATVVYATMWTTAYNCPPPKGTPKSGIEIINLAPAPGGEIPINFPFGNSIYRGDADPGQFTDPPGRITVQIDVTGKEDGCYTVAYSGTYKDSNGANASNTYFTPVCIDRLDPPPPPPSLSCVWVAINPASPEPGQLFKSTVRIRNSSAGSSPYSGGTASMTVSPPPSSGGSQSGIAVGPINGDDTRDVTTPANIVANNPGSYSISWTISGGNAPPITCNSPVPFKILTKPYFRVYGGDVLVGMSRFGTCAPALGSSILAYNRGDGAGSGGQLAVQAMAAITEFSSATGRNAAPKPRKGLSFANTNTSGTYGGNFGDMPCNKDYYGTLPATASEIPGTSVNPKQLASGAYYHTGPRLDLVASGIGGGLNFDPGKKIVIYVDGDVSIKRDIKYTDSGWNDANIPSFWLIVKGNIYIEKGFTQIDGVYIAQPKADGSKGQIFTCAAGYSVPTLGGNFHGDCIDKLTVNGTFIAQKIHLLRTKGTLLNSSNGEQADSGTIAEVFNFSPELWIGTPAIMDPKGGKADYDAITSLPPVL